MTLAPPTSLATRRSPFGAAAAVALALLLPACASSGAAKATVVSTAGGSTTSAAAAAAAATTKPTAATKATTKATTPATTAAATTAPIGPVAPDPTAVLAKAVDGLRPGYDVDSNVAAAGRTTNMAGRVIGTNSLFTLTSGDAVVEYLLVPPQTWVREPGGAWNQANTEAAPREALGPLAAPKALAFVTAGADGQHLHATYDGAALGSETPAVEADMVVEPNGGLTVTYAVTTQGKALAVVTRLAPAADTTPIEPPT